MTATQDVNEIDGVDLGVARSDIPSDVHSNVRSPGTDAEVELLRAEVDRLYTLLVTENVGLAVGILMSTAGAARAKRWPGWWNWRSPAAGPWLRKRTASSPGTTPRPRVRSTSRAHPPPTA